ncbi:MAG: hypothetical protein WCQ49_03155 [Candidatus Saccharibacteria bacterium]
MNKKSQSGSAHLIIIVILIISLLGALGFVFWQNFMQPKVNNAVPAEVTDNQIPGRKTLSIPELGIKGYYTGDLTLKFDTKNQFFTDDTLGKCLNGQSGFMGSISRYSANDTVYYWRNGVVAYISASGETIEGDTATNLFNAQTLSDNNNGFYIKHISDYYYFISATNTTHQACEQGDAAEKYPGIGKASGDVLPAVREFAASAEAI